MSERNVGVPWTTHEDALLTQAVARYGEGGDWKTIALYVPGRTNKACRKRWLHSLSPSVKKTAWTPDEDRKLLDLYSIYHTKWAQIAREIPGRTDDACSKRYREALDPALKKDEWTPEEDTQLAELFERLGGRWGQIGHELQRSGLGCRNRWRLLLRKKGTPNVETPPAQRPLEMTTLPEWRPPTTWTDPGPTSRQIPYTSNFEISEPTNGLSSPPYIWSNYQFESHHSPPPYFDPRFSSQDRAHPAVPTPNEHNVAHHLDYRPADHLVAHNFPPAPQVQATFQFSSSSLSAALSDPLPSRPLPAVSHHPSPTTFDSLQQPSTDAYASCPIGQESFSSPSGDGLPLSDARGTEDLSMDADITVRVASPLTEGGGPSNSLLFSSTRTRSLVPVSTTIIRRIDERILQESSNIHRELEDSLDRYSGSGSSTPLGLAALNLSPMSSPSNPASPIELPSPSPISPTSVLYSPYHRSIPNVRRLSRRRSELPRLDSALPATLDRSVKPYACGYDSCWPSQSTVSRSCFATSKELSDHSKETHNGGLPCDKPFRCGLEGCGKSWRSINGLQYHLQISKSHFQHALSSRFSLKCKIDGAAAPPATAASAGDKDKDSVETTKKKRLYPCPHAHCFNEYRQLGGLRYHLMHGHPEDMPAQLEIVPPTLARKVEEKMRAKAPDL